jgi:transposase
MAPRSNKPSSNLKLPNDVQQLQSMVRDLHEQVEHLKRMIFGRRSEKLGDPNQGGLFGGLPSESPAAEDGASDESSDSDSSEEEQSDRRGRRKRRSGGRQKLPAHLLRHVHEIHPPEAERTCACCNKAKTIFGKDVTEELEVIPARYFVNQYVRFKYACACDCVCCQGGVSIGPLPSRPIDKGIPGPGFLAQLIVSKYADALPLYRQQQILRRFGLEISRTTMCDWISHVSERLSPIVEAMKVCVKGSRRVHTDDTPITVLDRPCKEGDKDARCGYMWVYIGEFDDVVFDYTNQRNRDGPAFFLKGYRGYLQADAFSGYDGLYTDGLIIEVGCWAHARRKFFDALKSHPTEARHMLKLIARLYAVERRAKALGIDDERLLAWRQRHSAHRLQKIREELDRLSVRTLLPKSLLAKAINYALNNWKALTRYTEAAYLAIDNNHSERQIKLLVIGRKNWLFCGSEQGAKNAAVLYSLMGSCKLAGVDPAAYLRDVLLRIHNHPADRIGELSPRQWKQRFAPQPETTASSLESTAAAVA